MNQHMLPLLFLPMISFGMQDPREWKSDLDDGSLNHMYKYLSGQVKEDPYSSAFALYSVGNNVRPVISRWWERRKFIDAVRKYGKSPADIHKLEEKVRAFPLKKVSSTAIETIGATVIILTGYATINDLSQFNKKKAAYLKDKEAAIFAYDTNIKKAEAFVQYIDEMSLL